MKRRDFLGCLGGSVIYLGACSRVPVTSHSNAFKLLFFTDVHTMEEFGVPEALDQLADQINKINPDLIIGGGDYIHRGFNSAPERAEKLYQIFAKFLDRLDARTELMIGNHDLVSAVDKEGNILSGDPRAMFREKTGVSQIYRSFDFKEHHVIILDTIQVVGGKRSYRAVVDTEQLDWIKRDLQGVSEKTPIILASHVPLRTTFMQKMFSSRRVLPHNLVLENANEVLDLFKGHQLKLVLQGHLHVNERIYWNDTAFVMGGAVCGRWWTGINLGTSEGFGTFESDGPDSSWNYHNTGWKAQRPRESRIY
ncbi:MAG: metallophosphoesterase [Verrucomicrobiota bacterium]